MTKHKFSKYGSLASPCKNCGIEFAYTVTFDRPGGVHWDGVPCKNYTSHDKFEINRKWCSTFP